MTNTRARLYAVLGTLALGATALVVRAVDLQVVRKDFYQDQGDQRFLRERTIPVSRGMIVDRNGEPLAVSTPVESIWAQPQELLAHRDRLPELAAALGIEPELLEQRIAQRAMREFVYLRRHLAPDQAAAILALAIPGVNAQREFRRYYPGGEVFAHLLGFTDIDDSGQEGLELAFDEWLAGTPGVKRVIQDRRGAIVEDVEMLRASAPGRELKLSIDRRVQYLAYRELKAAMVEHRAESGSMVILDVTTGEIVAMVNWPSYNPNLRGSGDGSSRRNRAVTDVFEPGSVIKAFTVAAGIESGKFDTSSVIETNHGTMPVGNHLVRDVHDYGAVNLERLLVKSSNVAAATIAAALDNEHFYDVFRRFGFGAPTGCGFPGESPGVLPEPRGWGVVEKATLSYGYGLSVTPLQLAAAYGALASGGRLRTPTFVHGSVSPVSAVLDPEIAATVTRMLESVVDSPEGTGTNAAVPNFSVAGKTGTSRKAVAGGYEKRYISSFAGVVPASRPRLAGVVVVSDPRGAAYYAGYVAAPVFGRVMPGALRLLNVTPDRVDVLMAHAPAAAPAPPAEPDADSPYAEGVPP
ncbi:MAG TPA: penicillin-binding protein 2 [Candidatus Saccharimonadia bacterium]|nr:penicillin-binding protein 2 [Candidatus Saccharimonadia bacterium]